MLDGNAIDILHRWLSDSRLWGLPGDVLSAHMHKLREELPALAEKLAPQDRHFIMKGLPMKVHRTKFEARLSPAILACMLAFSLSFFSFANDTTSIKEYKKIDVGSGEMGVKATVVEGPPIKADQVLTEDHPEYARGMVCVECHQVAFDAITTSTKVFLLNYKQLPNDEVWKKIEAFLPGRERFVLTTVYNNEPTATTVDMVLDKDEKCLYVLCEKGTEKLMHIQQNPRICAVHYRGWTLAEAERDKTLKQEWASVQIRGNAEVIPPGDPQFEQLVEKYKPVRVTPQRARLRFDIVRITPTSAIYFDTNLAGEKLGVYQHWERKDDHRPSEKLPAPAEKTG